jgi:HSP20 family molecular chaperone IbpA
VALPDPRARGASSNSNAAASSPEYSPESLLSGELLLSGSASSPPPLDATVYEVEAHPDAIRAALEDAAFRAFLAESAMLHVERDARPGVRLDRARGRRCYTARRDATPATAAAAAVSALRRDGDPSAGAFKMSGSLLESIASMAVVDDRTRPTREKESAARGEGKGKPLVEEVRDWSVRVARGADAAPVAVEVTVTLPGVRSAGDADLEVTERYVRVRTGDDSRVVALPVAVEPGTATAAFKKKTKTLVIKARARRKEEAGERGGARR